MAIILGGCIASKLIDKYSIRDMILYTSIIYIPAYIIYILLIDNNTKILSLVTLYSALVTGMHMRVFVNYLSQISQNNLQSYIILTFLIVIRNIVSTVSSGYVVEFFSWNKFFIIATLINIAVFILTIKINSNK